MIEQKTKESAAANGYATKIEFKEIWKENLSQIFSPHCFSDDQWETLVNISEDGWFGSSIGPKQHFAHSIFRSVESGKYLLRSANNGIAAIVNPLGVVEQKVEYGQSGYIDFKKAKKIQPTLFSKYGNKIFIILILLYIFMIFSFNRLKNE